MAGLLLICAMQVLGGDAPGDAVPPQEAEQVTEQLSRPLHQIHRELRTALQEEAETKDAARWASSVIRLTLIYGEIMRDPRLPDSPTLAGYRVKLRARLRDVQKDLQREMERQGTAEAPRSSLGQTSTSLGEEPWTMALGGESIDQLATRLRDQASHWGQARGGAARGDYGPLLVELIRQTIAPEFWDVHGGPGVILYYRPGHALVVRATGDIHRQVGGTVDALRK